MVAPMKGSVTGPAARVPFDELMESTPAAEGVTCEKAEVGGLPGWWCRPGEAAADTAILYLHGGAYVVGSARAYRHFVGQVAARAKVAAYRGLVEQGFLKIAVAGDFAGGGLALVLLSLRVAKARDGCVGRPVGAAVMSPWTDLALSGTSMETRSEADPLLTKDSLASTAKLYLDGHDPSDPQASPFLWRSGRVATR